MAKRKTGGPYYIIFEDRGFGKGFLAGYTVSNKVANRIYDNRLGVKIVKTKKLPVEGIEEVGSDAVEYLPPFIGSIHTSARLRNFCDGKPQAELRSPEEIDADVAAAAISAKTKAKKDKKAKVAKKAKAPTKPKPAKKKPVKEDYDWYRYSSNLPMTITKQGKIITITKGFIIGAREAKTKKDVYRIVLKGKGSLLLKSGSATLNKLSKRVKPLTAAEKRQL